MSVFRGRDEKPLVGVGGEYPRKETSIEIGRKAEQLLAETSAATPNGIE